MSILASAVRPGIYRDSILLMQLQAALTELPGVQEAGAVMATPENLELLATSGLEAPAATELGSGDLLIVVKADSESAALDALDRVDALLGRESGSGDVRYNPQSIETASRSCPRARFALVSVPGRYASTVADRALDLGLNVFLFSDHVPLEEEIRLKRRAGDAGLLVMGPDCGTALIGGIGLGFANRVRRGSIGIVSASGTGLQAVACAVHERGAGVSHAIGTGGRDLSREVGAATTLQALDLLRRDPGTGVIVLLSKPPDPDVAERLLEAAAATGKPTVVAFQGAALETSFANSTVCIASGLGDAADIACELAGGGAGPHGGRERAGLSPAGGEAREMLSADPSRPPAPLVRGLFAGGTLALEMLLGLRGRLAPLSSNLHVSGVCPVDERERKPGHVVLDLGADEYTAGRPHPMIDHGIRTGRLQQEASDPDVGLILLDVVLGFGAHEDPAAELAPAIAAAGRPNLEIVTIVVGTDADPQGLESQIECLETAGAIVRREVREAVSYALRRAAGLGGGPQGDAEAAPERAVRQRSAPARTERPAEPRQPEQRHEARPVPLSALEPRPAAINIGLERFAESVAAQGAEVVHVDWRPPAGGDARLGEILEKLRR